MYHAARTTTCRLCEYQCYVAGNNALHSIAVDSAWWINAACQATIVNNSRSGAQGISTNVALPAGGCCYETMLLPRTSKQGKEKTLKIVAFGPSALRQQFSMSSLSPVLRYVIIIHSTSTWTVTHPQTAFWGVWGCVGTSVGVCLSLLLSWIVCRCLEQVSGSV